MKQYILRINVSIESENGFDGRLQLSQDSKLSEMTIEKLSEILKRFSQLAEEIRVGR